MLTKNSFQALYLCLFLLFHSVLAWSQDCSDPNTGIFIDIGENLTLDLGDSAKIELLVGTLVPVANIEWSPNEVTCIAPPPNCFDVIVKPFVNTCYSVTVTNTNGCSASDEVCVVLNSCDFIVANSLIDISPDNPSNQISLNLDIVRTQVFSIEFLQNADLILETRKFGHLGPNNISVDISSLDPGEYELKLDLYPDPIFSSFTKQ